MGAAKAGNGFTDVAMDSVHYDSISCLSYYGITTGKTADTYNPGDDVTRSQMALFLTRAAGKAGIDLGDAMSAGFTDVGSLDSERVDAINRLASKGIMPGRTATTFDPEGLVTRGDMAQHLFTLLDLALDSVHIDSLPPTLDGDGTGIEVNVSGGDGMRPDDYFGDVRRTQPVALADMINAVYELGVTTGTNNTTGDTGTFEPTKPVTRAQMASFIMRALGHTNLRPAGLTVQQTSEDTQISVRDADFKPVVDRRVELISSSYPDDAFDRSGRCITDRNFVTGAFTVGGMEVNTSGFDPCSIDLGDERTNTMGNVAFGVGSGAGSRFMVTCTGTPTGSFRFTGEAGAPATVWAWQGDMGDAVDRTDLVEAVAGNAANPGRATSATVSGGSPNEVKMGQTLTYEIQLRNSSGQPAGPTPGVNHDYAVTIVMMAEALATAGTGADRDFTTRTISKQTTTHSPDGTGKITIPIRYPDPTPYAPDPGDANDSDVQVSVEVVPVNTTTPLPLIDRTGGMSYDAAVSGSAVDITPVTGAGVLRVEPPDEVFSDNASVATSLTAVSTPWRLRSGLATRNRNTISVQVSDQYGGPYRGATHEVVATSDATASFSATEGANEYAVGSSGGRSITYTLDATESDATTETVTLTLRLLDDSPSTPAIAKDVAVQWADRGESSDNGDTANSVLVGDPRSNIVVVEEDDAPAAYEYGPDDAFFVEGVEVTLAQFEEVLGSVGAAPAPIENLGNLSWARYDYSRPRDGATFELTSLVCR